MSERLQKILAAQGVASRREAERLITKGCVSVNGVTAQLGQSADISVDEIKVNGVLLGYIPEHYYIMLNKPRGYITTVSDDRGRKTVMELVSELNVRIYPVGRLDMESEGLLLLTNDGHFANLVAHPSREKLKTYEVCVRGNAAHAIPVLKQPMMVDSHLVQSKSIKLIRQTEKSATLEIAIGEGRNRQIRKMCKNVGLEVVSLKRISIGDVKLDSLPIGKWRNLTDSERFSLMRGD